MPLEEYYVGKFSIYNTPNCPSEWTNRGHVASDPFNPSTWNSDSLDRLRQWERHAEAFRVSTIVAIYSNQRSALDTEKKLIMSVNASCGGLRCLNNMPYATGRWSLIAEYYAVYLLAR